MTRPTRAAPAPSQFATNGWLANEGRHGRIAEGYGALDPVSRIRMPQARRRDPSRRCRDRHSRRPADELPHAVTTAPSSRPMWRSLPCRSRSCPKSRFRRRRASGLAAAADIGFGNVVKILLRFATKWWADHGGRDLADLSFLLSDATVPTWWTQHPAGYPVLTGWFAGPKADRVSSLTAAELVEMGLASLAEIFDLPLDRLRRDLVASRAINWGNDPFARGAYSYATPKTREAQSVLGKPDGGRHILFRRGALCRPGYGHGRGGVGERTGNGADDPGRRITLPLLLSRRSRNSTGTVRRLRTKAGAIRHCRRAGSPGVAVASNQSG